MANEHNRDRNRGTVKRWLPDRGFGFITPDSSDADLFVPVREVLGGYLTPGMRVEYSIGLDREGRRRAVEVETLDDGPARQVFEPVRP